MTRQIKLKKKGKGFIEKVDFLREVTEALLDEVKMLTLLKTVEIEDGIDFDEEVKSYEIQLIEYALEKTGGNQLHAAQLLNLNYTTLNSKIKRYAILKGKQEKIFSKT